MPVDLAIATPTFLDLTFVGLEGLPALGEERFAGDLLRSPGGGAITAVGAARLGLSVALASPVADDPPGLFLREQLAGEGVRVNERRAATTPVTVVLPVAGDRAMVTVDPGVRCTATDIAGLEPRAVAASLDQLNCVPSGVPAYVTCGDDDARAFARRPPAELAEVRALFLSRREACVLTDRDDVEDALGHLGSTVATVVITGGADGAIASVEGRRLETPVVDVGRPVDTTGAGDLFVAAYVWADQRGAAADERLAWAALYAGLSVTRPTAVAGAVSAARLLEEGARRGLTAPAA